MSTKLTNPDINEMLIAPSMTPSAKLGLVSRMVVPD